MPGFVPLIYMGLSTIHPAPWSHFLLQHCERQLVTIVLFNWTRSVAVVDQHLLLPQVRVHDAHDCDLYLRVRSRPIIEDSSRLRFAPFAVEELLRQWQQEPQGQPLQQVQQQLPVDVQEQQVNYSCGLQLFAAAQLGQDSDSNVGDLGQLWQQVDDFGWVKVSQSPNWVVLPATERQLPLTPADMARLLLTSQQA
jgi:hypothetical protein